MYERENKLYSKSRVGSIAKVLIILILLGGAGADYYKFYNLSNASIAKPTPSAAPPPAAPTPTPAWRTYTNPINTVSISHPAGWEESEEGNSAVLSGQEGKITIKWGDEAIENGCPQKNRKAIKIKDVPYNICEFIDGDVLHGSGISNNIPGDRHTEISILVYKPLDENSFRINMMLDTLNFPDREVEVVTIAPEQSCELRPACLDDFPPCNIEETPEMCPR